MAKKDDGSKRKMLKEVKITAKGPKRDSTSVTRSGEVANRRIDSMKKANPGLGRAIGTGYKGSGGKRTFGPEASDAIKAGISKSTAAAKSKKKS